MDNNTPINNTEDPKRFISLLMPVQKKVYAYVACHVPQRNDSGDVFQEVVSWLFCDVPGSSPWFLEQINSLVFQRCNRYISSHVNPYVITERSYFVI